MKKIFALITIALFAISANAQLIKFSEEVPAGVMDGKEFPADGLVLKSTDEIGKQKIDANVSYFGTSVADKVSFNYRIKTSGKSSDHNKFTLVVPSDGKLLVYARTGSNSAVDRKIVVWGETEVINAVLLETDTISENYKDAKGEEKTRKIYPPLSAEVTAGTYTITYPAGAVNIYGIALVSE